MQSAEDPSSVLAAIDDTRVTLVDADGNVVYDSYGATDNHGDREEIIAAMNGEPEVVGRYSQTMGAHLRSAPLRKKERHRSVYRRGGGRARSRRCGGYSGVGNIRAQNVGQHIRAPG